MKIKELVVTPFSENCYVLYEKEGAECAVIDPGGEAKRIQTFIKVNSLNCTQIWLTHSHLDHCGGVAALKNETSAKLFGSSLGKEMRQKVTAIKKMYGIDDADMENSPEPEVYLKEGDLLSIAGVDFAVLETPGHSPDHLCFYSKSENLLINGDCLFNGSIGRTDLPGGDHRTLLSSIRDKLFVLPDETVVLCGHGPNTTIGEEKRTNPFLIDDEL